MDLNALAASYPGIRGYREGDDRKLFEIFEQHPMKAGGLELYYDRGPSFCYLLKHQAPDFRTIVCEKSGRILGFFSFSWGPRYVNGQKKNVAYIGDFRVNPTRETARIWRKFYPHFLSVFLKNSVDYALTGILAENKDAIRSLVERGSKNGFYYHPLRSKIMINIMAHKAWARPKNRWVVNHASSEDSTALKNFLNQDQKEKVFGYVFDGSHSEWERRQQDWAKWDERDFLIVKKDGHIVACCLPWSPTPAKRMRVGNTKGFLKWALKLARKWGLNFPEENKNIEILYLTHLAVDRHLPPGDVHSSISSLIDFILRHRGAYRFHMLSLAVETPSLEDHLAKQYFLQSTPINLYQVSASPTPDFDAQTSVGFEMALV